jgi:hypothetical protein
MNKMGQDAAFALPRHKHKYSVIDSIYLKKRARVQDDMKQEIIHRKKPIGSNKKLEGIQNEIILMACAQQLLDI